MHNMVFLVVSVAIAAFIGYVTNYLAIKMLFHPRKAWTIRGWRVPFTPGLIPKRRSEIAVALGRVVSEYLVTADGIRDMLLRPELRGRVEQMIGQYIEEIAERDETFEELVTRLIGAEATEGAKRSLEELAKQLVRSEIVRLWLPAPALANASEAQHPAHIPSDGHHPSSHRQVGEQTLAMSGAELHNMGEAGDRTHDASMLHRPLADMIDTSQIPIRQLIEREGASRVLTALRDELSSASGKRLIHNIVTKLLDGLGGMVGMFAGIFLDEDKLVVKVRQGLLSYLDTPGAHDAIVAVLAKQLDQLMTRTPAELLGKLREQLEPHVQGEEGRDDATWYADRVARILPIHAPLERLWGLTPRELLHGRTAWLIEQTSGIAHRLVEAAATHIEQGMGAIDLPRLVREQVERFPMEQVEQVILSITGREFKAITWLGALLGGVIGIVQAMLYMMMGS